jgi:hypothetical protein
MLVEANLKGYLTSVIELGGSNLFHFKKNKRNYFITLSKFNISSSVYVEIR